MKELQQRPSHLCMLAKGYIMFKRGALQQNDSDGWVCMAHPQTPFKELGGKGSPIQKIALRSLESFLLENVEVKLI